MKVAVCAIGRMENHYIREFVEYYKNLDVDTIFLYDNNLQNEEHFEEVISDYIDSGFVKITDFRGKRKVQALAYQDCYEKHGDEFDWILIIDCDEFLIIDGESSGKSIKKFLSQEKFKNFDSVGIQWMIMDDNNQVTVKNNDYSLMNRFTTGVFNRCGKRIVRGGLKLTRGFSAHGVRYIKGCDVNGNPCITDDTDEVEFSRIQKFIVQTDTYFKHFMLKTLEEYVTNKMIRYYPNMDEEKSKKILTIDFFFCLTIKRLKKK